MRIGEAQARLGEAIDVRRRERCRAVRGHVAVAEIVGVDEDDVGSLRGRRWSPPRALIPNSAESLVASSMVFKSVLPVTTRRHTDLSQRRIHGR